jgi:hypothetical protein
MTRILFFMLSMVFFVSSQAGAEPALEVTLAPESVHTGETAALTIQVSWPKEEGNYSFGIPTPAMVNLQLVNQAQSQETFLESGKEWTRKTFTYELTPEKPGQGIVESFSITYVNPAAVPPTPAQWDVQTLSLKVEKPPFKAPVWLKPVVGLTALAAGGAVLLGLLRSRKSRCCSIPHDDIKQTIEEAALLELQKAESVHALSRVFREFLSRRYSGLSSKQSESEMTAAVQTIDIPREEIQSIQALLEQLGEAKYTGPSQAEFQMKDLRQKITAFIESKRVVGSPA